MDLERLRRLKGKKEEKKKGMKGLDKDSGRERMLLVWERDKHISKRAGATFALLFLFENQVYFSPGDRHCCQVWR